MHQSYYKSSIGLIKIEATEKYVVNIGFVGFIDNVENSNAVTKACEEQLDEYFSNKRENFHLPIKLNGTEFQQKVWKEFCKIPYGIDRKEKLLNLEKENRFKPNV